MENLENTNNAVSEKYTKSNLCQIHSLGLSCVGCCGGELKDKEQVLEDIKKNTLELTKYKKLKEFIERAKPNELRDSGICRNMTFIGFDKKTGNVFIGCPAHPEFEETDNDVRAGHCDIKHLCKAVQLFETWSIQKQTDFFEFLEQKVKNEMDWFEYSIKMDNDEMLQEFELYYEARNRSILNKIELIKN